MPTEILLEPGAEPSAAVRPYRRTASSYLDRRYLPVVGSVVVLVLMLVIGGTRYENFLSPLVMSNLLIDNSYLVVLAIGMTFVILTGGIDLSVGAVVALSGVIGARMFQAGLPATITIPAMILIGTVLGLLVGVMVLVFEVEPFIATLAAMFLARGLCYVFAPESIPIRDSAITSLATSRYSAGEWVITVSGIIALLVLLVALFLLHFTRFGRTVYAIGEDEASARLMGLPVARTKLLVYVFAGSCSGVAGLLFAVSTRAGYSRNGIGMETTAIAAVVIGGTLLTGGSGYVLGSLLGVLALGLIQTMITFEGTLSSWWTAIFIASLLFLFVILQRVIVIQRR
jgi:ribose/xylose/arabinose/galactoside ABC-type transport system permease subunit